MKKFSDAFNGLKIAFRHKAVMIQLVLGIMAIIGGMIIRPTPVAIRLIRKVMAMVVCTALLSPSRSCAP